jgi:enoyl-CoA hydratase/carnithine racemase
VSEVPEIPPFQVLRYEVADHVCSLTLNRPEKRNALSGQLVNELLVGLETAQADPRVRVIVLTGAGNAFCAGGDLSQMQGGGAGEESGVPFRGGFVELMLALARCHRPVIAKVRRYALGGGLGLVCSCTFAIAEDTATFGTPEIDRGIFPMMIMASIFRTVSRRDGLDLILSGERISAERAARIGILSRAVAPESLDSEVADLAARLASKAPSAIRLGLDAYHIQGELNLEQALPFLQDKLVECLSTEDAAEGLMAYFQKREPQWTGR